MGRLVNFTNRPTWLQPLSCKRLAPSSTSWLFHRFAKHRNMLVKHNVFCHVKPHVSLGFWSHFSNAYVFLGFLHFWYFLQKPLQNQWFCKIKNVKNDRLHNSLCIFAKPLQNQCEQTLCFTRVAGRWDDLWPTTFPLLHTCTTFWAAQKMKVPNWRKRSKDRGKQVGQTDRQTDWQTDRDESMARPPPLSRVCSTGSNRQPLQLFSR